MSHPLQLTQWRNELESRFPELPARVVFVLALYSFAMILAHGSGLTTVTCFLTSLLGWPYNALRKRLSEFYKEASAKSGSRHGCKRRDFDVSICFAPLLRWVLSLWSGSQLALAIDVTNLGERFHVLCISVVVRGNAIPVAWKVLYGGMKDPWNPHWEALLRHLKGAVPADWTVIVLSDRGLESSRLFQVIKDQGWHPLMRVKKSGKFRPKGWGQFYSLADLVKHVGGCMYVEGRAYAGEKMPCTLLAQYAEGYSEPWFLLTDLPPETGEAVWYAFRAWIEQGFKVIKSGGWDWDKTRMEDPQRVERLWLVMAVATLWVVAIGADDEVRQEAEEERKRSAKKMAESLEEARKRLEQEQLRRERQMEAQREGQARKQRREALKEELREKARSEKKAKKSQERTGQEQGSDTGGVKKAEAAVGAKTTNPRKRVEKVEGARARTHRVSRRGLTILNTLWRKGQNCLPQHLHPDPWPKPCHHASTLTEKEFLSQQT